MIEGYEEFTESQIKILQRYVTNTTSNVFVFAIFPK